MLPGCVLVLHGAEWNLEEDWNYDLLFRVLLYLYHPVHLDPQCQESLQGLDGAAAAAVVKAAVLHHDEVIDVAGGEGWYHHDAPL